MAVSGTLVSGWSWASSQAVVPPAHLGGQGGGRAVGRPPQEVQRGVGRRRRRPREAGAGRPAGQWCGEGHSGARGVGTVDVLRARRLDGGRRDGDDGRRAAAREPGTGVVYVGRDGRSTGSRAGTGIRHRGHRLEGACHEGRGRRAAGRAGVTRPSWRSQEGAVGPPFSQAVSGQRATSQPFLLSLDQPLTHLSNT